MEQDLELVLFRRRQLLFLRRDHYLLLQGRGNISLNQLISDLK